MSQTTFRFKFTKQLLNSIREFSKIHSNDNCDDFLEAFQSWTYENREMIQLEEERLKSMGFNKDINAKIYKSARYYFKNKKNKTKQNDAVKVNSNIKFGYISRNPKFFKMVENYISSNPIKASVMYKNFMDDPTKSVQIEKEVNRLITFNLDREAALKKIQKTFNNAYYKIKKKSKKDTSL